jgi:hypothetical protein
MKIVGMYDYLLFDDNQERRRQFRAKANSNRRKLQQETRKVVEAFYADKANWPLIIAAKARDGGKHGRGDMDSELWAALFVAFFGTPANGIGDLRWDEILLFRSAVLSAWCQTLSKNFGPSELARRDCGGMLLHTHAPLCRHVYSTTNMFDTRKRCHKA